MQNSPIFGKSCGQKEEEEEGEKDNRKIITAIQISVRKTTFYDKSSFFIKIIGDAFRTDYVCSLSSHFTH